MLENNFDEVPQKPNIVSEAINAMQELREKFNAKDNLIAVKDARILELETALKEVNEGLIALVLSND